MKKEFTLEDDVINLEWAAKNDKQPPKGKKYQYLLDEELYISDTETRTGREILENAGKAPVSNFILRQKVKGNWKTIQPDDVVDFTEAGVEKFKTLPNDQTEGSSGDVNTKSPRRDFVLLEEDEEFLNSIGSEWEAARLANVNWIFIHKYGVVSGYNMNKATIGFRLTSSYPTDQIDMVYFHPALKREDGQVIGAVTELALDEKMFQQWSRHRTASNPWRPGIDNLSTHYPLVEAWLLKEFEKRPYYAKTA